MPRHIEATDPITPAVQSLLVSANGLKRLTIFAADQQRAHSVEANFASVALKILPSIPDSVHMEVGKAVHAKVHEHMRELESLEKSAAAPQALLELSTRTEGEIGELAVKISHDEAYRLKAREIWGRASSGAPKDLATLRSSILVSAVSDFEVLVSAVIRGVLSLRPEILRTSESKFSYSDLEKFGSLDDFRAHCADQLADSILRGGFEDWVDWLAKRLKVEIPGVTVDAERLIEIFQRRHLWVHNGGFVNRFYLAKVDSPGLAIGQQAKVSFDYLTSALDMLVAKALIFAYGTLLKLDGDKKYLAHQVQAATFSLLEDGRFRVVEDVANWVLTIAEAEPDSLTIQVNLWVARKRLHGIDSIRDEVTAWRTDHLAPVYVMAQQALQDQTEATLRSAEDLFRRGELSEDSIRTWPLLKGLRDFVINERPDSLLLSAILPLSHQHGAPEPT